MFNDDEAVFPLYTHDEGQDRIQRHRRSWGLVTSNPFCKALVSSLPMLRHSSVKHHQSALSEPDIRKCELKRSITRSRAPSPTPTPALELPNVYEVDPGAIPLPGYEIIDDVHPSSENIHDDTTSTHRLSPLDLPEILERILSFLDDWNPIPSEPAPVRRKPLSFQHALLIYHPDVQKAKEAWERARREEDEAEKVGNSYRLRGSGLYSCLIVSQQFRNAAIRVLSRRAAFQSLESWHKYVRANQRTVNRSLRTLVLHKIRSASMHELVSIGALPKLEWLELHVCPDLFPTEQLLGSHLRKIAVPGGVLVSDEHMYMIAQRCPNLRVLDLRACEKVTDDGLVAIAQGCPKLKYLNVGRVNGGDKITSVGVEAIAKYTRINTFGLAGCQISDSAMWAIAQHRGKYIERLSLNGCELLSNDSVPKMLAYTPNLQVLELRGCVKITNVGPIVEFRRRMPHALIEGCEVFEQRMRYAESRMQDNDIEMEN